MHNIALVLGDWSGDGHDKTSTTNIECNLTKKELEKAYKKGCKKVDSTFSMYDNVAEGYGDRTISREHFDKLVKLGFKPDLACDEDYMDDDDSGDTDENDKSDGVQIWQEGFVEIWMFIASLGTKTELLWKEVEGDSINIGGYGFFD